MSTEDSFLIRPQKLQFLGPETFIFLRSEHNYSAQGHSKKLDLNRIFALCNGELLACAWCRNLAISVSWQMRNERIRNQQIRNERIRNQQFRNEWIRNESSVHFLQERAVLTIIVQANEWIEKQTIQMPKMAAGAAIFVVFVFHGFLPPRPHTPQPVRPVGPARPPPKMYMWARD